MADERVREKKRGEGEEKKEFFFSYGLVFFLQTQTLAPPLHTKHLFFFARSNYHSAQSKTLFSRSTLVLAERTTPAWPLASRLQKKNKEEQYFGWMWGLGVAWM